MAHQIFSEVELDTGYETLSAVLSDFNPNITPGCSLLGPTPRRINTPWIDPYNKNVIEPRSELFSAVGERFFTDQESGNCSEIRKDCIGSVGSFGERNVDQESFLSPPSELVDPPHELLFSANDDMENCRGGLSGEEVENELRVCSQVSSTSNTNKFVVVKCEKKKNPPYLLDGNIITTRNETAVKFHLKFPRAGQEAKITLRYDDPIRKDTPVTTCREHRGDDMTDSPENSCTFRIPNAVCRYEILDGHRTAFIPIKESSSCMEIIMVFKCLNSCHRNQPKKIDLLMTVVDPASQNDESDTRFDIRVCKNVKRDHKDRKRPAEVSEERPRKLAMMFPIEQPGLSLQVKKEKPSSSGNPFLVYLTPEQQMVLLPLLRHMNIQVDPYGLDVCNQHPGVTSDN